MSKIQLSPYVNFQGRAREAMAFYHNALGGKLGQGAGQWRLETDGMAIVATDGHPNYPATVGDHMAIAVGGTDKERLTSIFTALAEGGRIQMPLAKQPGGAEVGWLKDKFGINWTVSIDQA